MNLIEYISELLIDAVKAKEDTNDVLAWKSPTELIYLDVDEGRVVLITLAEAEVKVK